ncbi:unnamed protein product [Callosobruchus maculatus]|nr:unnamed protein product [Callosobruchus maculatus]
MSEHIKDLVVLQDQVGRPEITKGSTATVKRPHKAPKTTKCHPKRKCHRTMIRRFRFKNGKPIIAPPIPLENKIDVNASKTGTVNHKGPANRTHPDQHVVVSNQKQYHKTTDTHDSRQQGGKEIREKEIPVPKAKNIENSRVSNVPAEVDTKKKLTLVSNRAPVSIITPPKVQEGKIDNSRSKGFAPGKGVPSTTTNGPVRISGALSEVVPIKKVVVSSTQRVPPKVSGSNSGKSFIQGDLHKPVTSKNVSGSQIATKLEDVVVPKKLHPNGQHEESSSQADNHPHHSSNKVDKNGTHHQPTPNAPSNGKTANQPQAAIIKKQDMSYKLATVPTKALSDHHEPPSSLNASTSPNTNKKTTQSSAPNSKISLSRLGNNIPKITDTDTAPVSRVPDSLNTKVALDQKKLKEVGNSGLKQNLTNAKDIVKSPTSYIGEQNGKQIAGIHNPLVQSVLNSNQFDSKEHIAVGTLKHPSGGAATDGHNSNQHRITEKLQHPDSSITHTSEKPERKPSRLSHTESDRSMKNKPIGLNQPPTVESVFPGKITKPFLGEGQVPKAFKGAEVALNGADARAGGSRQHGNGDTRYQSSNVPDLSHNPYNQALNVKTDKFSENRARPGSLDITTSPKTTHGTVPNSNIGQSRIDDNISKIADTAFVGPVADQLNTQASFVHKKLKDVGGSHLKEHFAAGKAGAVDDVKLPTNNLGEQKGKHVTSDYSPPFESVLNPINYEPSTIATPAVEPFNVKDAVSEVVDNTDHFPLGSTKYVSGGTIGDGQLSDYPKKGNIKNTNSMKDNPERQDTNPSTLEHDLSTETKPNRFSEQTTGENNFPDTSNIHLIPDKFGKKPVQKMLEHGSHVVTPDSRQLEDSTKGVYISKGIDLPANVRSRPHSLSSTSHSSIGSDTPTHLNGAQEQRISDKNELTPNSKDADIAAAEIGNSEDPNYDPSIQDSNVGPGQSGEMEPDEFNESSEEAEEKGTLRGSSFDEEKSPYQKKSGGDGGSHVPIALAKEEDIFSTKVDIPTPNIQPKLYDTIASDMRTVKTGVSMEPIELNDSVIEKNTHPETNTLEKISLEQNHLVRDDISTAEHKDLINKSDNVTDNDRPYAKLHDNTKTAAKQSIHSKESIAHDDSTGSGDAAVADEDERTNMKHQGDAHTSRKPGSQTISDSTPRPNPFIGLDESNDSDASMNTYPDTIHKNFNPNNYTQIAPSDQRHLEHSSHAIQEDIVRPRDYATEDLTSKKLDIPDYTNTPALNRKLDKARIPYVFNSKESTNVNHQGVTDTSREPESQTVSAFTPKSSPSIEIDSDELKDSAASINTYPDTIHTNFNPENYTQLAPSYQNQQEDGSDAIQEDIVRPTDHTSKNLDIPYYTNTPALNSKLDDARIPDVFNSKESTNMKHQGVADTSRKPESQTISASTPKPNPSIRMDLDEFKSSAASINTYPHTIHTNYFNPDNYTVENGSDGIIRPTEHAHKLYDPIASDIPTSKQLLGDARHGVFKSEESTLAGESDRAHDHSMNQQENEGIRDEDSSISHKLDKAENQPRSHLIPDGDESIKAEPNNHASQTQGSSTKTIPSGQDSKSSPVSNSKHNGLLKPSLETENEDLDGDTNTPGDIDDISEEQDTVDHTHSPQPKKHPTLDSSGESILHELDNSEKQPTSDLIADDESIEMGPTRLNKPVVEENGAIIPTTSHVPQTPGSSTKTVPSGQDSKSSPVSNSKHNGLLKPSLKTENDDLDGDTNTPGDIDDISEEQDIVDHTHLPQPKRHPIMDSADQSILHKLDKPEKQPTSDLIADDESIETGPTRLNKPVVEEKATIISTTSNVPQTPGSSTKTVPSGQDSKSNPVNNPKHNGLLKPSLKTENEGLDGDTNTPGDIDDISEEQDIVDHTHLPQPKRHPIMDSASQSILHKLDKPDKQPTSNVIADDESIETRPTRLNKPVVEEKGAIISTTSHVPQTPGSSTKAVPSGQDSKSSPVNNPKHNGLLKPSLKTENEGLDVDTNTPGDIDDISEEQDTVDHTHLPQPKKHPTLDSAGQSILHKLDKPEKQPTSDLIADDESIETGPTRLNKPVVEEKDAIISTTSHVPQTPGNATKTVPSGQGSNGSPVHNGLLKPSHDTTENGVAAHNSAYAEADKDFLDQHEDASTMGQSIDNTSGKSRSESSSTSTTEPDPSVGIGVSKFNKPASESAHPSAGHVDSPDQAGLEGSTGGSSGNAIHRGLSNDIAEEQDIVDRTHLPQPKKNPTLDSVSQIISHKLNEPGSQPASDLIPKVDESIETEPIRINEPVAEENGATVSDTSHIPQTPGSFKKTSLNQDSNGSPVHNDLLKPSIKMENGDGGSSVRKELEDNTDGSPSNTEGLADDSSEEQDTIDHAHLPQRKKNPTLDSVGQSISHKFYKSARPSHDFIPEVDESIEMEPIRVNKPVAEEKSAIPQTPGSSTNTVLSIQGTSNRSPVNNGLLKPSLRMENEDIDRGTDTSGHTHIHLNPIIHDTAENGHNAEANEDLLDQHEDTSIMGQNIEDTSGKSGSEFSSTYTTEPDLSAGIGLSRFNKPASESAHPRAGHVDSPDQTELEGSTGGSASKAIHRGLEDDIAEGYDIVDHNRLAQLKKNPSPDLGGQSIPHKLNVPESQPTSDRIPEDDESIETEPVRLNYPVAKEKGGIIPTTSHKSVQDSNSNPVSDSQHNGLLKPSLNTEDEDLDRDIDTLEKNPTLDSSVLSDSNSAEQFFGKTQISNAKKSALDSVKAHATHAGKADKYLLERQESPTSKDRTSSVVLDSSRNQTVTPKIDPPSSSIRTGLTTTSNPKLYDDIASNIPNVRTHGAGAIETVENLPDEHENENIKDQNSSIANTYTPNIHSSSDFTTEPDLSVETEPFGPYDPVAEIGGTNLDKSHIRFVPENSMEAHPSGQQQLPDTNGRPASDSVHAGLQRPSNNIKNGDLDKGRDTPIVLNPIVHDIFENGGTNAEADEEVIDQQDDASVKHQSTPKIPSKSRNETSDASSSEPNVHIGIKPTRPKKPDAASAHRRTGHVDFVPDGFDETILPDQEVDSSTGPTSNAINEGLTDNITEDDVNEEHDIVDHALTKAAEKSFDKTQTSNADNSRKSAQDNINMHSTSNVKADKDLLEQHGSATKGDKSSGMTHTSNESKNQVLNAHNHKASPGSNLARTGLTTTEDHTPNHELFVTISNDIPGMKQLQRLDKAGAPNMFDDRESSPTDVSTDGIGEVIDKHLPDEHQDESTEDHGRSQTFSNIAPEPDVSAETYPIELDNAAAIKEGANLNKSHIRLAPENSKQAEFLDQGQIEDSNASPARESVRTDLRKPSNNTNDYLDRDKGTSYTSGSQISSASTSKPAAGSVYPITNQVGHPPDTVKDIESQDQQGKELEDVSNVIHRGHLQLVDNNAEDDVNKEHTSPIMEIPALDETIIGATSAAKKFFDKTQIITNAYNSKGSVLDGFDDATDAVEADKHIQDNNGSHARDSVHAGPLRPLVNMENDLDKDSDILAHTYRPPSTLNPIQHDNTENDGTAHDTDSEEGEYSLNQHKDASINGQSIAHPTSKSRSETSRPNLSAEAGLTELTKAAAESTKPKSSNPGFVPDNFNRIISPIQEDLEDDRGGSASNTVPRYPEHNIDEDQGIVNHTPLTKNPTLVKSITGTKDAAEKAFDKTPILKAYNSKSALDDDSTVDADGVEADEYVLDKPRTQTLNVPNAKSDSARPVDNTTESGLSRKLDVSSHKDSSNDSISSGTPSMKQLQLLDDEETVPSIINNRVSSPSDTSKNADEDTARKGTIGHMHFSPESSIKTASSEKIQKQENNGSISDGDFDHQRPSINVEKDNLDKVSDTHRLSSIMNSSRHDTTHINAGEYDTDEDQHENASIKGQSMADTSGESRSKTSVGISLTKSTEPAPESAHLRYIPLGIVSDNFNERVSPDNPKPEHDNRGSNDDEANQYFLDQHENASIKGQSVADTSDESRSETSSASAYEPKLSVGLTKSTISAPESAHSRSSHLTIIPNNFNENVSSDKPKPEEDSRGPDDDGMQSGFKKLAENVTEDNVNKQQDTADDSDISSLPESPPLDKADERSAETFGRIAVIHTLNRKTQSQTFNASASKPDKLEPPRDASTISSFQNTSQDQLGDDSSDSVASNEEITNIVNPKDYISSDNKIHPLSSSGTIYAAEASDIPTAKQLLDSQKSIASHQATVDTAEPNEDMLNQNKNRNEEDQYNNMAYNSDKSKSKASNSKSDSSFGKQAIGFNKSSFGRSTFKYINPVPLVPHVFKEKVLPDHRKQQANGIDTHTVPTGHTKLVEDNTEDDVNRQHAYDETVATDIPVGKKFLKETQSPIVLNSIGSSADVTEAGEDISDQHKNEFQKDDDKNGAYRSDKHKIQILNASNTEPDLPIREKLIVDKTNNEQDTYVNFAPLHFAETVSPNQKQDHSSAIDSNHTDLVKLTNDSTTDDVNSKLFDHTNLPISSLTSTLDETATSESPAAKKLLGNAKTPSVPESMEFAATGAGKYNVDKYVDGKEQGRSRTKGQSSNALTFEAQSSQQKDLEDIGDATTTSETIKLAENIAKEQATRKLDGSVQDSIGLPDGNFKDNFAVQQSPKESLPHLVANHLDKGITTIKDEERILKQIGRDGKFGSADHNDLLRQDSSDDDHVDGSFSINRTLKPPQNSAGEGNSKNNTPSISSDSGVIKDSMTEDGVSKDITVEPPTNKTTSTVIEKDYGSSRKNVDSTDKTYSAKYESPSKQSEKPFTEEANERFDDVASTSTTEAARYKIVIEKLPPKEANNSKDDKNVPQSSKKPFATANAKDAILQHINNVIPKLLDEGESTTAKALPNTKVSANTNPDKQQLRKHDNSDSMDENENGDSKDSNNTEPGTSYSVNPGADTAGIYKSDEYESKTEDRIYKRDIPVSLTMDAGPLNRKKSLTEVDVAGKQGLVRLTRSNDDKRYDTLSSKYIADEADHVQPGIGIIQSKVNRSSIGAASSALTNRDLAKKSKSKRKHYASETAHGRYKRVISLGENEAEAEPLNLRKPLIEAKFDDDGKWDFGRSTWSNDKRYDTLSSKYIAEEADHVQPGIGIIQSKVNSSSPDVPKSGLTNTDKAKKSNSKSEQFESETTDHKYKPSIAVSGENAAEPLSFRESLSEANFRDAEGPKRSPDDKRYDTLSSKYIAGEADHVQPGIGIIQSKVNSRSPHVPKCALTNTDKAKKSNSKSEGIETEQLSPKNEEEFPGEPYPSVARDETDIGIQANMYNNPELPPPALPILMIENEIDSETNEHDADVTKFLMKGTGKEFSEFAAKYKPPNDDIRELDIYSHERKSSHRRRQCPGCRSGKVKKVKKVQSEEETTVVSDAPSEEVTTVTEPSVVELTVNVDVVHNPEAPPPPLPLRDIIRGIQDGSFDGLVEKLEQATDELDIYHHEYVSSTSEQNPASQVPESQ